MLEGIDFLSVVLEMHVLNGIFYKREMFQPKYNWVEIKYLGAIQNWRRQLSCWDNNGFSQYTSAFALTIAACRRELERLHREWTEHNIMELKPPNKYKIIWKYHNFTNILITNFQHHLLLCCTKVLLTSLFADPWITNYTDKTINYYFIYSGTKKVLCKIMQHMYFMEIWFFPWYRNISFWGITVMCDRKYLNKLRHCAKYLGKSFSMQSNSKNLSSV